MKISKYNNRNSIYDSIRNTPLLSDEEVKQLLNIITNYDTNSNEYMNAMKKLVTHNLRLALAYAGKRCKDSDDFDELIQKFSMLFIHCVNNYKPGMNAKFSTYLSDCMKGAFKRHNKSKYSLLYYPSQKIDKLIKYDKVVSRLENDDRQVSDEIVAKEMKITVAEVKKIKDERKKVISLNAIIDDEQNELEMFVADSLDDSVEQNYENEELKGILSHLPTIIGLSEKEKAVYFGRVYCLKDEAKTLEEIGQNLGVTRERVRQIELGIKKKIMNSPYVAQLKEYY